MYATQCNSKRAGNKSLTQGKQTTRFSHEHAVDRVAHNPSGVDPTEEQWKKIADLAEAKKAICIFDTAYQVQEHPGPLSQLRLASGSCCLAWASSGTPICSQENQLPARQYAVTRVSKDVTATRVSKDVTAGRCPCRLCSLS